MLHYDCPQIDHRHWLMLQQVADVEMHPVPVRSSIKLEEVRNWLNV